MANVSISSLPVASSLSATDVFVIDTATASKQVSAETLQTYVLSATGTNNLSISTAGGDWIFADTGNLSVPGNIVYYGASPAPLISGFSSITAQQLVATALNGNLVLGDATATGSPGLSSTSSITLTSNRAGTAKELVFDTNGNLSLTGDIVTTGNVNAGHLTGEAGNISNVQGANVSGAVAYATTANSVSIANVSGIGNIASINLTGSSSNVLYGNGVFAPAAGGGSGSNIANGNSNVNIGTANGNVTIAAVGNSVVTITGTGANITGTVNATANISTAGYFISGNQATGGFQLGNVNARITAGGSNAYITMGPGLYFTPDTAASAFAGLQVNGGGYILAPNGSRVITLGTDGSLGVTSNINAVNGGNISTTGTVLGGNITASVSLTRSGTVAANAWTTNGIGLKLPTALYNEINAPGGTVANSYIHNMGAPTLIASNATTYTNYATLFVAGPTPSTNVTITNNLAIFASGNVSATGNVTVSGTAGIITPNKPGFRVTGGGTTTNLSNTTNTTGVLNANNWTVDYNQGNHLNTTTGVFTAPVAGLYSISLVARTSSVNNLTSQLAVNKNGSTQQCFWEVAANSTVGHLGVSTISKLAVNDTLQLQVVLGNVNFDANDNYSVAFIG